MRTARESPNQSTRRALQLLEVIGAADAPLGLMELASRAHLDKSTALRYLQALMDFALVSRDSVTKRYSLGPGLLSLTGKMLRRLDVRTVARPVMQRIGADTRETVSLHVRFGPNRLCVDGVESPHTLRRVVPIGELLPLYQGPTGKVILAFLPAQEVADMRAAAAAAGVDVGRLDDQLAFIRERGYLAAVGDRAPGVGGLSAPLFNAHGVLAALTVAGPAERWTLERMESFADLLRAEAAKISTALTGSVG